MKLIINKVDTGISVEPEQFQQECLSCSKLTHFDISGMIPPEWVTVECAALAAAVAKEGGGNG